MCKNIQDLNFKNVFFNEIVFKFIVEKNTTLFILLSKSLTGWLILYDYKKNENVCRRDLSKIVIQNEMHESLKTEFPFS